MRVLDSPNCVLGEGPLYCEDEFYWIDILGKALWSYSEEDGSTCLYKFEQMVSSIVKTNRDSFLLTLEDGFYELNNGVLSPYKTLPWNDKVRFNDGKCDKLGRYWAGTMDRLEQEALGKLYVLDKGVLKEVESGIITSNGLCWNEEMTKFYFIDSPRRKIFVYDFDSDGLKLSNKRVLCEIEAPAFPDGMTIDEDGNLWVALWDGFAIVNIDSISGEELRRIELPCKKVTSACFGGVHLDELYITSASHDMTVVDWKVQPDSGKVFVLNQQDLQGVSGHPSYSYLF